MARVKGLVFAATGQSWQGKLAGDWHHASNGKENKEAGKDLVVEMGDHVRVPTKQSKVEGKGQLVRQRLELIGTVMRSQLVAVIPR